MTYDEAVNRASLFITNDSHHKNVWFARTKYAKFARINYRESYVEIYFYPYNFRMIKNTMSETILYINKTFFRWFHEEYIYHKP